MSNFFIQFILENKNMLPCHKLYNFNKTNWPFFKQLQKRVNNSIKVSPLCEAYQPDFRMFYLAAHIIHEVQSSSSSSASWFGNISICCQTNLPTQMTFFLYFVFVPVRPSVCLSICMKKVLSLMVFCRFIYVIVISKYLR